MQKNVKCPNCGCDIKEAFQRQQEAIAAVIEERHSEELRWPRRLAKFRGAVVGLLLAASLSFVVSMFAHAIADILGYGNLVLLDASTYTLFGWLVFLGSMVIMFFIFAFVPYTFAKNASPRREKRLWEGYEVQYTSRGAQLRLDLAASDSDA